MKKKEKNAKQGKARPLVKVVAAIFILFAVFLAVLIIVNSLRRGPAAQKTVERIDLPQGITMNNPYGFTIFKSDAYGMPVYSFVKYEEERGENAFFKADLLALPLKGSGLTAPEITLSNPGLNAFVASKKIFLQQKREQELSGEKEKKESYDIDYRSYQTELISSAKIKDKQWNRYGLVKYENAEGGTRIKSWSNFYTLHNGCMIIIDYTFTRGLIDTKTRKTLIYEQTMKAIEADIYAMIEGINFN